MLLQQLVDVVICSEQNLFAASLFIVYLQYNFSFCLILWIFFCCNMLCKQFGIDRTFYTYKHGIQCWFVCRTCIRYSVIQKFKKKKNKTILINTRTIFCWWFQSRSHVGPSLALITFSTRLNKLSLIEFLNKIPGNIFLASRFNYFNFWLLYGFSFSNVPIITTNKHLLN